MDVKFFDKNGVEMTRKAALEKWRKMCKNRGSRSPAPSQARAPSSAPSQAQEWHILSGVEDENFIEKVNSKTLDSESLMKVEMTDLVRGAYYNSYLGEAIQKHLGLRPLPMITHINDNPVKLYPHQVKVLAWMKERESLNPNTVYGLRGGIIKLEMGLGKTLTGIIHSLTSPRPSCKESEKGFPTLVIASKTVMMEWKTQGFEKFFGDKVKTMYLHKDFMGDEIENVTRDYILKCDFVVTTYDVCMSVCQKYKYHEESLEYGDEHSRMRGKVVSVHMRSREQSDRPKVKGPSVIYATPWERVICDESQRFANPGTKTYRYIMAVYGRYKWCLTGTPIRNYETDIWAQLRFCGYNGITRAFRWEAQGANLMKTHKLTEATFSMNYADAGVVLPPKNELITYVALDDREKECYNYILGVARDAYDNMMKGLCSFACVLALFTRLRQAAIAPYLITPDSKRKKKTSKKLKKEEEIRELMKELTEGSLGAWCYDKYGTAGIRSKKMTEVVRAVKSIPKKEKGVVFSMFTSVLDLVDLAISEKFGDSVKVFQIDGDTKGRDREETLTAFRKYPKKAVLLMTYKVGSEGLNLVEANHVIPVEPWWTNAVHNQAKARCWRIGQVSPVSVHNVYVSDTIEKRVVEICHEKDDMAEAMLEGTGRSIKPGLDKYTLGRILGLYV